MQIFALIYFSLFLLTPPVLAKARDNSNSFAWVFISDSRIQALKQAVETRQEPTFTAFQALRRYADDNLTRKPQVPEVWYVPGYYHDAAGHRQAKQGLADDANVAYALALGFRVTGELKYAQTAVRLINTWATNIDSMSQQDDSRLSFSYHFPALIFAADLLRDEDVWLEEQQQVFANFLENRALPMNTMQSKNNWGNWGLVLAVSCAVYLRDEALFKQCVERWKYFIEHQIAADGHLPHEVNRSGGQRGIWYSHFCLMPQTIAAEIIRVNGIDLFDFKSPSGKTLQQAFEKVATWTEQPGRFPYFQGQADKLLGVNYFSYFEILSTHWPNDAASRLLEKSRPLTANHSAPFLTFTHGKQ